MTSTSLLVQAFPDFDVSTLPAIPAGFIDSSWKNDACPSFCCGDLQIFVDYADPEMREFPNEKRFSLHEDQADGSTTILVHTDDWSEVVAAIAAK